MGGTYGIGMYIVHVIKEIDFFFLLVNGVAFFKSEKQKLSVFENIFIESSQTTWASHNNTLGEKVT